MRITQIRVKNATGPLFGDGNLIKPCRDNIYQVCPGLAERWESNSDFTQWTFTIRDTAVWHDGVPFTAKDAKFWVELAYYGYRSGDASRAPSLFKPSFGDLSKVEVLEGNRIRLTLAKPFPILPYVLGNTTYTIAHPPHLTQPRLDRGEVSVGPLDIGMVGLGPFKLATYDRGNRIQVRRFAGYWERDRANRKLPYLDGMDFFIVQDEGSALAAFRVGRLDFTRDIGRVSTRGQLDATVKDLGDQVWFAKIAGLRDNINFNVLTPGPWQDARVRRAIMLWFDKQAAAESVADGFAQAPAMLDINSPYTSPDFKTWPGYDPATRERDRAEAKRLMREAGYPAGGFTMRQLCRAFQLPRCEFIQAQLAGLGIEVKLDRRDDAAFELARGTLDYTLQSVGTFGMTIPEQTRLTFGRYSLSRSAPVKHDDSKVEDLYDRLDRATTFDQRVQIWRDLERYLVAEQVYTFPWIDAYSLFPFRSYIKGVPVPPEGLPNNLDHATLWSSK